MLNIQDDIKTTPIDAFKHLLAYMMTMRPDAVDEFDDIMEFLVATRSNANQTSEGIETEGVELDENEIEDLLKKMYEFALSAEGDRIFKVPELFRLATDGRWLDLNPNSRKAIGRRFKKLVDTNKDRADVGQPVIHFHGRNLQNTAMYKLETKED